MNKVEIVEVGPRDGFQPIGPQIATELKIEFIRRLYQAGVRRVEATAFVSDRAVPQLADSAAVLAAAQALEGLDAQVLVPSEKYCEKALSAGARHVAFVLSVSEKHNINNVRRTPEQSAQDYIRLVAALPRNVKVRLNLATAFDCPFDGAMPVDATLGLLDIIAPARIDAEIALCDTTGRVTPDRVEALLRAAMARHPNVRWAYHGHDTYGLGVANALAALTAGVKVFDSSIGGLGGCPFAPGATGNVATEDLVWTLHRMGFETGIDLEMLLPVANDAAALPGALPGGRVRTAKKENICADINLTM